MKDTPNDENLLKVKAKLLVIKVYQTSLIVDKSPVNRHEDMGKPDKALNIYLRSVSVHTYMYFTLEPTVILVLVCYIVL